jgi:hypothetical protein
MSNLMWEYIEFDFRLDWIYDPVDGWLEFRWFSAKDWPHLQGVE